MQTVTYESGWKSTMPVLKICKRCGKPYIPISNGGRPSEYCGDECRERVNKARRYADKVRRKNKIKSAAVETVDPLIVFARDKWKCKLCGVSTPASKRGTFENNAPELDHIIPLSKGGDHSYRNTQCSCRRCNGLKADKPKGQTLLFG